MLKSPKLTVEQAELLSHRLQESIKKANSLGKLLLTPNSRGNSIPGWLNNHHIAVKTSLIHLLEEVNGRLKNRELILPVTDNVGYRL